MYDTKAISFGKGGKRYVCLAYMPVMLTCTLTGQLHIATIFILYPVFVQQPTEGQMQEDTPTIPELEDGPARDLQVRSIAV